MSLQINGSGSLEHLSVQLSLQIKDQKAGVFQSQYIVTQTQGMNNWLKIKIAGQLGIVANVRFLKPNELVNEIYFKLRPYNTQALNASSLKWVLFTLLADKNFQDRFRNIANYYTNDEVKRMALAEKVADLFDQYQIYRPEMISDWNENTTGFEGANGWQKFLWIEAKLILGESMPDKSVVGKHIIQALKQPDQQKRLKSIIPNIHVFGLSIITNYHVHIFYELSKTIDVTFHLLNPAPAVYWFEDKSEKQLAQWRQKAKVKTAAADLQSTGNSLLIGWGRVLQDTYSMFFDTDAFLNQYNDVESPEPKPQSLLGKIQNDIFNNYDSTERNKLLESDIQDGSITISSCYTVAREVEVLYNYLVHLVAGKEKSFSARDVVVMVSDIDAYAPYIKAIFNSAKYKFPFTIADESYTISDNLFSVLQSVLNLNEENFKAEEVLQLLDSKYIRTRFSLSDMDLIRKAVDSANIRFGIEGSLDDETIYVSWKNGIRRIMFGICMPGGDEYFTDGYPVYPLDIVEGENAFQLIRFCHFVEILISTVEDRNSLKTLSEWGEYIEQVVDKLICRTEDNNEDDYQQLLRNLEKLYVLNGIVQDKISFNVFKHSFVNSLATEPRSNSFASGGITFCSLIPMRSIPFHVVALLGLNFDKFPRKETRVSFNLMELEKRKGDRNVKENDKHLFLETILSAQKYLYLSYVGRSSKDNTLMPPSVFLDELIEYIQSGIANEELKVRERMVTTHPLHGFSHKYNLEGSGLYNYLLQSNASPSTSSTFTTPLTVSLTVNEVSIQKVISFFKNPFKGYYNDVLRIFYEQANVLLPENEVFELGSLELWQMKQDLLFLDNDEIPGYRNKGVATGRLPLKNMADWVIMNTETALGTFKELVHKYIGSVVEKSIPVELLVSETLIKGDLRNIYDGKIIFISFSKSENKYLIEAYIRFLIAIASGNPLDLYYFSSNKNKVYKVEESSRSKKSAMKSLERLLNFFKLGHEEILLFYPDFDFKPSEFSTLSHDRFKIVINKYFEGDSCDPYLQKEYSFGLFKEEGVFKQFVENSIEIYSEVRDLFDLYNAKE